MEKNILQAAILGSILGDSVGVPVEFMPRERLTKQPVTGLRSFGTHNQPAGTWSDDSSMSLATIVSLTEHDDDFNDVMTRFLAWLRQGEYTPFGICFDIGISTERAISRFEGGLTALRCGGSAESDNGNGALMRMMPVLFDLRKKFGDNFATDPQSYDVIHNFARITHAHPRNLMACGLYLVIANELMTAKLNGGKHFKGAAVASGLKKARDYYQSNPAFQQESAYFARIFNTYFGMLPRKEIKSSGYVVDTLEASLWSFLSGRNYADCTLKAVNLGGDADTIASLSGGLAGIYYGLESIPAEWLDQLQKKEWIDTVIEAFATKML
ncbi:ADP-ribosylglycohydrolase family protein [Enterococcus timonensis]|uniref:ADP-ribosylglycohydrolase family protein n=1 Tax=Enterococcus timonensis TaxID=1852364 RepID=UPI0008D93255|nr:ADP-ribosylglycohydrolase family protein [Enterococcus timonensis]